MIEYLSKWYKRYFSHPQAVLLVVFLVFSTLAVLILGKMLAPVLASLIIAYLLEGSVQKLEGWRVPRIFSVSIVFAGFLLILAFLLVGLMPILSRQLTNFVQQLPQLIDEGHQILLRLPELYPQIFTADQVAEAIKAIATGVTGIGQSVLSTSLSTIPELITLLVYVILGPILVFLFLKDKDRIVSWVTLLLPKDRTILTQVWEEMDEQIGNYVRGKVYEIAIVGIITYITFALLGLNYAPLLAVLVGLSVIIPYIGAAVITIPVAFAAYLQMGWAGETLWVIAAYGVLQFLDGNLLVPVLFSEVVNLHPIAIIVAVLVFGGMWGFWGVFFAIPLATLVNALLNAWPKVSDDQSKVVAAA